MTLGEALKDLLEANAEWSATRTHCQLEWSYTCQCCRDDLTRAEAQFMAALDDHIDNRIEAATGARP